MTSKNLLVELLVEELPPKALQKIGEAFANTLADQLKAQGLATPASVCTGFASPRRLALHLTQVSARAPDKAVAQKLMPVSVGLDVSGQATPALLKKLQSLGADASAVTTLRRAPDGKVEALFYDSISPGTTITEGLQKALAETLIRLPIPKLMGYQLADGWTTVNFVRPAHGLMALHGNDVVPVTALGLQAGRSTEGHRFEAAVTPVRIQDADDYEHTMQRDGAVIPSFAARKAEIARQLSAAAQRVGGQVRPIDDDALLDEVTALVERPNVVTCQFEAEFLDVPPECLILTMKANQKYFPLLDAAGGLTNRFLVVSNVSPEDTSAIVTGNERVVRPRLADAKFFFDKDRKQTLISRVAGLDKVIYHNKLGSQGERALRVRAIAQAICEQLGAQHLCAEVDTTAQLAKADLLTDMVGEFPELQGIMGGYYARHDGLSADVAQAIEDHYKPRFAGDQLPRNMVGVVVALADKLETLVGMFGIGNLPTGERDPYALRRHALGVIRMLVERGLALEVGGLIKVAIEVLSDGSPARAIDPETEVRVADFLFDRLSSSLREQGFSAQEVDAVLALRPQRLSDIPKRLAAVRSFAALPESLALAAANKRIGNILKKSDQVAAEVDPSLFKDDAEAALFDAMQRIAPHANAQFVTGDYTASLQALAALRDPVDAFFDGVMVNAEDAALRHNRLALLASLHTAMNRVADLSRLVVA